ncbi:MAG: hypothetical protein M3N46_03100 [Actinomycetota bacterium]|nr:hypothetical protein [Actinomycetota bacterium]
MSTVPVPETCDWFENESIFCEEHGLDLERLPHYGWLVRRVGLGHNRPVIGCIDEVEHGVELMEIHSGFRWTTFETLHDAVTHLVRAAPEPGEERVFDRRLDQESGIGRYRR